jgi:hypothetical protein
MPRERVEAHASGLQHLVQGAVGLAAAVGGGLLQLVRPHHMSESPAYVAQGPPDIEDAPTLFNDVVTQSSHEDAELEAFFQSKRWLASKMRLFPTISLQEKYMALFSCGLLSSSRP